MSLSTPSEYSRRKSDATGKPVSEILSEELGHKCRQLFTAMDQASRTGHIITPFAIAGECALLSANPGVERHEVYLMAKEIRMLISEHGVYNGPRFFK